MGGSPQAIARCSYSTFQCLPFCTPLRLVGASHCSPPSRVDACSSPAPLAFAVLPGRRHHPSKGAGPSGNIGGTFARRTNVLSIWGVQALPAPPPACGMTAGRLGTHRERVTQQTRYERAHPGHVFLSVGGRSERVHLDSMCPDQAIAEWPLGGGGVGCLGPCPAPVGYGIHGSAFAFGLG